MKRIYITRHAKSSWENMELSDHQRPLNPRGRHDAPRMAKLCQKKGYVPEIMISSDANRAFSTAEIFLKELPNNIDLTKDSNLYHAPADTYLDTCFGIVNSVESVMLFGHNPGITDFAFKIGATQIDNVPTCGILVVDADVKDWTDVHFSNCTLVEMLYPKML